MLWHSLCAEKLSQDLSSRKARGNLSLSWLKYLALVFGSDEAEDNTTLGFLLWCIYDTPKECLYVHISFRKSISFRCPNNLMFSSCFIKMDSAVSFDCPSRCNKATIQACALKENCGMLPTPSPIVCYRERRKNQSRCGHVPNSFLANVLVFIFGSIREI